MVDLRPLAHMRGVELGYLDKGVTFQDTPAAQVDTRLAEIAEIEDDTARLETLFEYLEDWEPPGEQARINEPEPDPLFQVVEEGNKLEVAASCPDAAEREDALKRAMHQAMPAMADRLARSAGNQFPRLADLARHLAELVDTPFETLDMAGLHLALVELRAIEAVGQEEGMAFEAHIVAQLSAMVDAGGALTVDHPLVTLLMERARKARENPDSDADDHVRSEMSHAVAGDVDAMGPRLRAMEQSVADNPDPQAKEAKKAINRNVLWVIGVSGFGFVANAVAGQVVTDLVGVPVSAFVKANLPLLLEVAGTYGAVFADWFAASLANVPDYRPIIEAHQGRHTKKAPEAPPS